MENDNGHVVEMDGCGFFSKVSHKPPQTHAEDSRIYEAVDGKKS